MTVSDGHGHKTKTSTPIVVVNSGPRARDVTRSTTLDAPVNVALTGHDADGDPLTFAPSAPSRGMIGAAGPVACSGTACTAGVTYTPPLGLCNGAASFSYAVSDGGLSDAATASITISTPRKPTTITLSQSLGVVSYLKSVKLTAHLGHISPGARISIFQTPYGSTRRRVASGTPSVKGNLVASVRMLRRSTFQAVGTSGNCYAWDSSAVRTVGVRALTTGRLERFVRTSGGWRIYGAATPVYVGSVAPSHAGKYGRFDWQRRSGHAWERYFSSRVPLNADSRVVIYLTSGVVRRVPYRVRIRWPGDADHAPSVAPWAYFRAAG